MTRSIRAVLVAVLGLSGLGQTPVQAAVPPTTSPPGVGLVNVQPVVFLADRFTPTTFNGAGGPADNMNLGHPRVWSLGRVRVAEPRDDVTGGLSTPPFAVGVLTVEQIGVGTYGITTLAVGEFVKSNDPLHPYRFQGVELSPDPNALRGQLFDFVGEQTGPVPPEPSGR